MTIAKKATGGIGARVYTPDGPFGTMGQFPFPTYAEGEVVYGENEAEFVYVKLQVPSSTTYNQGDVFVWDNGYLAVPAQTGSGAHPFGANVGSLFLGGRVGDPAAAPAAGNVWSYTFTTGVWGIWVQNKGTALVNLATVNAQTKPVNTTAVNGQLNAPASALAGSMGVNNLFPALTSWTMTATTTNGSAILMAVAAAKGGLQPGQTLSGTGIATGAVILDVRGSTVIMSLAATASGTVTVTAANNSTYVTTTNLSAVLTNVTSIAGIYPNQTIAGTGIPASTTIVSIQGNQAPYTITMSAAATATANSINATTTIYVEAMLRRPWIGTQN